MFLARLVALVVALAVAWPGIAAAKGAKTVHVRGYYRKDGTYVRPHMRSAPGYGSSSNFSTTSSFSDNAAGPAAEAPPSDDSMTFARKAGRTSYRTSARSTARTSYHLGALNAEANDSSGQPATTQASVPAPKLPDLPRRYIAHFTSGKSFALTDFAEKDGAWDLFPVTGGHIGGYPKSAIAYFEPTADALGATRTWTDSGGSHHASAKFDRIDGENVILAKDDGKTIRIPIEKLSETDRDLARRLQGLKGEP